MMYYSVIMSLFSCWDHSRWPGSFPNSLSFFWHWSCSLENRKEQWTPAGRFQSLWSITMSGPAEESRIYWYRSKGVITGSLIGKVSKQFIPLLKCFNNPFTTHKIRGGCSCVDVLVRWSLDFERSAITLASLRVDPICSLWFGHTVRRTCTGFITILVYLHPPNLQGRIEYHDDLVLRISLYQKPTLADRYILLHLYHHPRVAAGLAKGMWQWAHCICDETT